MRRFGPTAVLRPKGFSGVIFNTVSRVLCAFSRAVTCIDAKRASMLIHTALTTVTYPSPRCDRAPGSHEWLWRHLHVARSPGSCIPGRSEVARWKATITAVIVVHLYWPKSAGDPNGGHVSVSVGHRRIFSAQSHSSRAYRHLTWSQSA